MAETQKTWEPAAAPEFVFDLDRLTVADLSTLMALTDAKDADMVGHMRTLIDIMNRAYPGGAAAIPLKKFMTAGRDLIAQWGADANPKV